MTTSLLTDRSTVIAMEVARNRVGAQLPIEDLLGTLDLDEDEFIDLTKDPTFKVQVKKFCKELRENGMSFKLKLGIHVEDALIELHRLLKDADTPAAIKVKIVENFVKWAGLEPKEDKNALQAAGTRFSINFNWGNAPNAPQQLPVIDITPTSDDE